MASDLISRKALLEAMDKEATEIEEAMCIPSWATAKHCIKDMPTVDRWIPCSERMPKKSGTYLISGVWGSGKEAVGDCDFSVNDGYFRTAWNFDVLAWQPLPEPYKAGDIDG